MNERIRCCLCGRRRPGRYWVLDDGTHACVEHSICPACHEPHLHHPCSEVRHAITTRSSAKHVADISARVRAGLQSLGVQAPGVTPTITATLPDSLEGRTNNGYLTAPAGTRLTSAIEIVSGFGPWRFGHIYAHELTHSLLHLEGGPPRDQTVEEGLCELVGLARLMAAGGPRTMVSHLWRNPHPTYGAGLRQVAGVSKRLGLLPVLDAVRRTGRLPSTTPTE